MDRTGHIWSIRRPRRPGALRALMPAACSSSGRYSPLGRAMAEPRTPVTGVSELTLEVSDLPAAERFYSEVLCLPIVERWERPFRCDQRSPQSPLWM